jgi:hypothetical protein
MPSRNGAYDVRFCSLFLNELEACDHPRFPEGRWFRALAKADAEFKRIGPLRAVPARFR